MRVVLPFLLLFGFMSLDVQAQAPASTAQLPAEAPTQVEVPVQPAPAVSPQAEAGVVSEPVITQQPSDAEAATDTDQAQPEEPKQRSRAIWFLLGAVVVLAVVLAAS